jgi:hypothetical protein
MIAVLRAASDRLDLDACLRWIPPERLEASWRVGDMRAGRAAKEAGFNVLLADAEDRDTAMAEAAATLAILMPHVQALVRAGVGVAVDVGLNVYGHAPAFLPVSQAFLARVVESGVQLEFSAYPCSDEE